MLKTPPSQLCEGFSIYAKHGEQPFAPKANFDRNDANLGEKIKVLTGNRRVAQRGRLFTK